MRGNYQINSGVRFRMLSDDQLQELYDGVLHVMEYTGLDVHHEEAREILKEAGAWVDGNTIGKAAHRNLNVDEFIHNCDSFHFFEALNQTIHTGPTGTNVMDLYLLLLGKS